MKLTQAMLHELGLDTVTRWARLVRRLTIAKSGNTVPVQKVTVLPVSPASVTAKSKPNLRELMHLVTNCTLCPRCHSRKRAVFGHGDTAVGGILIVGEGLSEFEEQDDRPITGAADKLLTNILKTFGYKDATGIYYTNVVKCRAAQDGEIAAADAAACDAHLFRQVEILQPRVIIALGQAGNVMLGDKSKSCGELAGEFNYHGYRVFSTHHPRDLLQAPNDKRQAWSTWQKVHQLLAASKG